MNEYEELLERAHEKGIRIKEKRRFRSDADALINGNVIGLSENLETQVEKKCALAEELSHHDYNVGNIIDNKKTQSRQQEYRARKQAIFDMIHPEDLIRAFEYHVSDFYELADYLAVTEKFLKEALATYKQHYGPYLTYNDYVIWFDPLFVGQSFEEASYELC